MERGSRIRSHEYCECITRDGPISEPDLSGPHRHVQQQRRYEDQFGEFFQGASPNFVERVSFVYLRWWHGRTKESSCRRLAFAARSRISPEGGILKRKFGDGVRMTDSRPDQSWRRAGRSANPWAEFARPSIAFLQIPGLRIHLGNDSYNTALKSNAPFSFTATPFSVTIAVMSSAGVTSKLGL